MSRGRTIDVACSHPRFFFFSTGNHDAIAVFFLKNVFEFRESLWRPTAHLVLPCHIRLEVAPQSRRDSWKWFEARLWDSLFSDHAVGNG